MATPQAAGYHRAILVTALPCRIVAEMEDDFHHFCVAITHRGGMIASVDAMAERHPWSLCPAAAAGLQALVGSVVTPSLAEALGRLPIREHCTHMYDLACLATVYAAKGNISARRWDMAVDDPSEGERCARLSIDGVAALDWRIVGSDIVSPFAASLKRDFIGAVAARLSPGEAEAAMLLRRAVFVSGGRRGDLDTRATAADGARNLGGCFVMRPGTAELATRMRGASRQFSDGAVPLGRA